MRNASDFDRPNFLHGATR